MTTPSLILAPDQLWLDPNQRIIRHTRTFEFRSVWQENVYSL